MEKLKRETLRRNKKKTETLLKITKKNLKYQNENGYQ